MKTSYAKITEQRTKLEQAEKRYIEKDIKSYEVEEEPRVGFVWKILKWLGIIWFLYVMLIKMNGGF